MTHQMKKILFICLVTMVAAIGLAHYLTPGHLVLFHDTFRRLSYFPIAIGAVLYGVWGGLVMAILSCLSFIPHLYMFWYQGPEAYYSELSEILFYLAAGLVIGMISSRENRLKAKYKALSEQLGKSYRRLHDQAERLVTAEEELGRAQKLSLLGHVSASLAHEIKNPLASIKGAAEILADEVDPDHPKYEFVGIMRSEISRLNNSVEKVLDYCRGRQAEDEDEKNSLIEVMAQAVRIMEPGTGEKSVRISFQPGAEEYPPIRVPAAAMTQVMINLILNALEAVPAGTGEIQIFHGREGDGYRIHVDDNGPGLEHEIQDEVFTPFVTFKEGGTGLGLSITKKIIQRLGGDISAGRSDLGGARFSITLPLKPGGH